MRVFKQALFFALGVIFIFIGIAGLVLPILPGWVFLFMGLSIIAPRLAARLRWWVFRKRFKNDILLFDEWMPAAEAGYTTRHFSVFLTKTEELLLEPNQAAFSKLFSAGRAALDRSLRPVEKFVLLKQVHGDRIAVLDDAAAFTKPGFYPQDSSDGVITCVPDMTLLVLSADCLSVFFLAGEWVGLAHAGWRGTKAGIAAKILKLISEKAGIRPDQVRVIFGPRIGVQSYEVGAEFRDHFPDHSFQKSRGKLYFDLALENKRQLLEAGAKKSNFSDHGICTVRHNADFYSFRKEKEKAGRIISFITKL